MRCEESAAQDSAGAPVSEDERELEQLLFDRMHLDIYEDRRFAGAVELAVRDMWYAQSITVQGETVPRERVRQRLRMLDVDCADALQDKMHLLNGDVAVGRRYLMSVIYNLPAEVRAAEAAFFAGMGGGK